MKTNTVSRRSILRWIVGVAVAPGTFATSVQDMDWAKRPIQILVEFPAVACMMWPRACCVPDGFSEARQQVRDFQ